MIQDKHKHCPAGMITSVPVQKSTSDSCCIIITFYLIFVIMVYIKDFLFNNGSFLNKEENA